MILSLRFHTPGGFMTHRAETALALLVLALLSAAIVLAELGGPGPRPDDRIGAKAHRVEGVILDQAGDPVDGALVTLRNPTSGRALTRYARADGRFELEAPVEEVMTLEVRGPEGEARPRSQETGTATTLGGPVTLAAPASGAEPTAAAFLALLPEGLRKRRFVVDCTGCHTFGDGFARQDGRPRAEASWASAMELMLSFAGPGTPFPIISGHVDPDRDAPWLAAALRDVPRATRPLRHPLSIDPEARLTEYAVPEPGDLPHDLAVGADGLVVVTGMLTHRMYVLDPTTGAWDTEVIPVDGANPRAVDIDPAGRWMVALGSPRALAVYDPSLEVWTMEELGAYPHSIALDGTGRVWFNGHFSARPEVVGWYRPADGAVRRFEIPNQVQEDGESTIQYGLRVGPDGTVWSTQLRGNRLVRLDPDDGTTWLYPLPTPGSGPRRPDVSPDGTVWVPQFGSGTLARFDPSTETFREMELPVRDAGPYVARVDHRRGTVWVGTAHADLVLAVHPGTEEITAYPLPTRGALIRHLDIDEETGALWAAYGASPGAPAKVLRIEPGDAR